MCALYSLCGDPACVTLVAGQIVSQKLGLVLAMLYDKKDSRSLFKPYYDVLPSSMDNIPIFWNESKLQYLKGSLILESILRQQQEITAVYDTIIAVLPSFAGLATLDEFLEIWMSAGTRSFGLTINGKSVSVVAPLADMMNHRTPKTTVWSYDAEFQALTVVAISMIAPGSEIFTSYGYKSNRIYLMNYGFVVENNVGDGGQCPNDVEVIISVTDWRYHSSLISLFDPDLRIGHASILLSIGDNDSWKDMMALVRVATANKVFLFVRKSVCAC